MARGHLYRIALDLSKYNYISLRDDIESYLTRIRRYGSLPKSFAEDYSNIKKKRKEILENEIKKADESVIYSYIDLVADCLKLKEKLDDDFGEILDNSHRALLRYDRRFQIALGIGLFILGFITNFII